eukprot:6189309-Pleurochrysis_carterae.AAC.3
MRFFPASSFALAESVVEGAASTLPQAVQASSPAPSVPSGPLSERPPSRRPSLGFVPMVDALAAPVDLDASIRISFTSAPRSVLLPHTAKSAPPHFAASWACPLSPPCPDRQSPPDKWLPPPPFGSAAVASIATASWRGCTAASCVCMLPTKGFCSRSLASAKQHALRRHEHGSARPTS